jgi:primosomal protein N' (replication factor Y) (superfamily II helicase)
MRVVTVAPFASGIPYEELSYFSKDTIETGDLVEIAIKRRICKALVLDAQDAREDRQSLRHASFNLKKVNKVVTKHFLPPKLWGALSFSSSYLLQPLGTIIYDLLSEKSFDTLTAVSLPTDAKGFELLLLEQSYENRITRYKTTIRESFSKKRTLVMFFPTITDLEYARDELSRGIEDYVVTLHSGLTEKQYKDVQKQITENPHPLLILSTPSILPWIRKDLGLVIIEREHSHYYYTHGDQGYDTRFVIEQLARASSIPCLLGSHMLSLRAHMLYKSKDAHEIMPLQFRNDSPISIIPMHDENKSASPYLSRTTLSILHNAKVTERGHFFLYAHRKGMYPTTVCSDCGTLFTCPTCNRPYVLHKIAGIRTYVCHGCENIVQLNDDTTLACRHCGGWRMQTLGIATAGVEEELKRLGVPLFIIDGEHTPTRAKVKKVYKEWQDASYGVLIGTEMAHNIIQSCDGVIILSLDSLFSLPEYRTDEKILSLVTEMAEKVKQGTEHHGKLILQTRLKNLPVIKQLTAPSFREVYDTLLKEREQFLLPPHYTVIKASFDNLPDTLRTRMEQELEPYVVEWFEQGRGVTLLFIHIKETEWANNTPVRERIKRIVYDGKPLVNPLHFFI